MRQVYLGALELLESKIEAVGIMMSRTSDAWTIHSLRMRMGALFALKRRIIEKSGLYKNVIHVDFQERKRVS